MHVLYMWLLWHHPSCGGHHCLECGWVGGWVGACLNPGGLVWSKPHCKPVYNLCTISFCCMLCMCTVYCVCAPPSVSSLPTHVYPFPPPCLTTFPLFSPILPLPLFILLECTYCTCSTVWCTCTHSFSHSFFPPSLPPFLLPFFPSFLPSLLPPSLLLFPPHTLIHCSLISQGITHLRGSVAKLSYSPHSQAQLISQIAHLHLLLDEFTHGMYRFPPHTHMPLTTHSITQCICKYICMQVGCRCIYIHCGKSLAKDVLSCALWLS